MTPLPAHPHGAARSPTAQPQEGKALTPEDKKEVERLKKLDADVRRHEQAHLAAAGRYGQGPPTYEFRQGPDGRQYAVGGHVNIDTAEVEGDPQATLEKARVVKRAALAPSEPSDQDRKVAREAEQMAQKAQRELREQQAEEAKAHTAEAPGTPGETPQPASALQAPAAGYTRTGQLVQRFSPPGQLNVLA